ncbi:MAG: peptidylprolyl isomerase [Bacteroidetes bacterium]|nr:peptidylprolyl isomerase [Bacteroidota bacterium]
MNLPEYRESFLCLAGVVITTAVISVSSCRSGEREERIADQLPSKAELEEVNRYLVRKDRERIENYIERKKLAMEMTRTGLWYGILDSGAGDTIKENDIVLIKSQCTLLDGTVVYTGEERGTTRIRIGRSSVESGLDEGLRMLRGGGKALFILPSYLGHGLLGDGNKIPSRAILVFEVSIIGHNDKMY